MQNLLLIAVALLVSCAPAPVLIGGPTSSPAAASVAPHAYREITPLGDAALLSPDGQTLVYMLQGSTGGSNGVAPSYVFQRLDGTVIWQRENAMGWPEWLPDSSGVFIPLAAMQRAGPLGVLHLDGTLAATGLDDANPALSPDGAWIAAERREGCCVGISIHEIRIAPRAGGPVRTLVTSTEPGLQPVSLLGWSSDGAVIYRDGAHIRRMTLDGRITELAAAPISRPYLTRSAVSPDGRVILGCAADPLAFWVIAGGTVADLGAQPAWPAPPRPLVQPAG